MTTPTQPVRVDNTSLTPQELLRNAWTKFQSAKQLLATGQYDDAAYLAGYTVELTLKARYCTRVGLASLPATAADFKKLNGPKLNIHDLETLLSLAEGAEIRTSTMRHIDWERALDWTAEQRYRKPGSVKKEDVEAQLTETEKLFGDLVMFEIVEKLQKVEVELSAERGEFNLFAVVYGVSKPDTWELMVSAWWLTPDPATLAGEAIIPRIRAVLHADLLATIPVTSWWHPHDDWVRRFQDYPRARHAVRYLTSHNFMRDRFMPTAYIITNAPVQQS